jgi:diguanylate cyclase (GGDEF)-like protein/PAS domain S-box-containing protein
MFTIEPGTQLTFLTNEAGHIDSWNGGCETLFGLRADQVIGQPMALLLAGDTSQDWPARWHDLAPRAAGCGVAVMLRCAHTSTLEAMLALAMQHGPDGRKVGCIASLSTRLDTDAPESVRVGQVPLAKVVDLFPGTFYAINRDRRFVLWNHNLETLQEMSADEIAAANPLDMFDLAQRPRIAEQMRRVLEEGAEARLEAEVIAKSGRETPMVLCGTRIHCENADYLFGVGIDISEQRAQQQQLRLRERALHAANNGIVITSCAGRDNPIEYVNPAFERITGYTAAEIVGRDSRFMAAPGLDTKERAELRRAINERHAASVQFRNKRKNGELFWNDLSITPVLDENGKATHFIGVLTDITAVKQRTAHLEHAVNHDPLTGLANRNLLWDRLEQALHLAQRNRSRVAAVLIDLDNFKGINDNYGHEAGDHVLKMVARRLAASVRDSDTVARLSGDEFVLVLVNQPSQRFTLRMIERVRDALVVPVSFNGREIAVGASLGVATYPQDGTNHTELMRGADLAMYHAKATGHNEVQFFSADMKASTEAKQKLHASMREALERDEMYLLFQPRIDAHTERVCGFEALLRWRHPQQGLLLPAAFLPDAEENGCIVQIGHKVLDQACSFVKRLRERGHDDVPVSVNVSEREVCQDNFIKGITERLERYGLPPASLELELREETLIRNPGLGRDLAGQLRALGLSLSVDEFGQGISDLGFLQDLSASHVKLAKSAVHALSHNERASDIAKALIDIGHNLKIPVAADAVETGAQMEFLRNNGCDEIQGMWFSAPLRAEDAERLLDERQMA